MNGKEKTAMWNAFYDELEKIAETKAACSMARGFAKKLVRVKKAGVVTETIGGVSGALLTEKLFRKFHPSASNGAHILALTGGALAGVAIANKLRPKEPREGTPGSHAYTMGKEDHSGMGLWASSMYLQRSQSGLAKAAAVTDKASALKRNIIAGLAVATAVGVGAKLLHNRHKYGRTFTAPLPKKR